MPAGPGQILGSRVDVTSQDVYMADVTPSGALVVSPHGVSPTDSIMNNPAWQFLYMTSGTATGITLGSSIGSIVQTIGTGSFVQVITYTNNNITNIGSWS